MKFFVYPYTQGSASAKVLAEDLEGKRVLREGSTYKHQKDHVLINWGASDCPHNKALNYKIGAVIDKREFFTRLAGTGLTPQYATTIFNAVTTLTFPIFCRVQTKGHDGQGVTIADKPNQLVEAPLYVEGIEGKDEYRVHIGRLYDGTVKIIAIQKKVSITKTPDMKNIPTDKRIRCGDTTGFVWDANAPAAVTDVTKAAFEKFPELTFGGFDVILSTGNKAYVLEINSAPALTPEATKRYGAFFRTYAEQYAKANGLANLPTASPASTTAQPVASTVSPASPVPEKVELVDIVKSVAKTTELLTCYLQQ